jgi:arylsulfatase A-like enzyme
MNRTSVQRLVTFAAPLDQPHFLGGRSSGAVRQGDWKLIEFFDTSEVELYSLATDPSEEHNVAANHQDTVAMLKASLVEWQAIKRNKEAAEPALKTNGNAKDTTAK